MNLAQTRIAICKRILEIAKMQNAPPTIKKWEQMLRSAELNRRGGPMMTAAGLKELVANPAYKGIDVVKEAWKFKSWCEANNRNQSVRRFVNWLNKVALDLNAGTTPREKKLRVKGLPGPRGLNAPSRR